MKTFPIIILLISYSIDFALTTKFRLKKAPEENLQVTKSPEVIPSVNVEPKLGSVNTELTKKLHKIRSESRKQTNEILAELGELRKLVQGTKSGLETTLTEIKSELHSLSLQRKRSDLKLQQLDKKLESCNSMMINSVGQIGDMILQTVQNSSQSKMSKLEQLDGKIDEYNVAVVKMGATILETLNKTSDEDYELKTLMETITGNLDTKSHLKTILETVDKFKNQAVISGGGMIDKANGLVKGVISFLKKMALTQLNETLHSLTLFENTTVTNSIQDFWPLLKQANFPATSLTDVFQKFAGILREKEWIIIQTRGVPLKAGSRRELFYGRTWTEYRNGFGSYDADFWFGLGKIHDLTQAGFTELRVEMEDWDGNLSFAQYSHFYVSDQFDNYRLNISGYSGDAGDSMTNNNGQQFSTIDRDNDRYSGNCAARFGGPWWHDACGHSCLNYDYQIGSKVGHKKGIIWYHLKSSYDYSLKKVEMKIRRPR